MLDQGALIRSGQAVVPDYAQQEAVKQQSALAQQQIDLQRQAAAMKAQGMAQEQAEAAAYQQDVESVMANPTPDAIARLQARYPKQAEGVQKAWGTLDEARRGTDLRHLGEMFSATSNGRPERAAEVLERRIAAERESGMEVDPEDERMLTDLRSGNPEDVRAAQGRMGMILSAIDPDKFATNYGALNPKSDPTNTEQVYQFILNTKGQADADAYIRNIIDPLVTGGNATLPRSAFEGGGFAAPSTQSGGGDPASSGRRPAPVENGRALVESLFPSVTVTSNRRGAGNPLTKANPGSWHAHGGGAVDVAPIKGLSFGQYVAKIKAAGYPIIEARDEVRNPSKNATGPHWHVVIGKPAGEGSAARVTSKQQFDRLASGTEFIAPDGSRRRKP